ncbi:MAG: TetR/AcrR family transcriptional regulator [Spirochaetales bacterium]|nr:TetR/AcrR family transcriptional regulator [Spirochaetales bacterium]
MIKEEKKTYYSSIKRRKFTDAGFRLFSQRSIEAVTLDEVASEAGVGIATLYRYFENKPNLVIEIATDLWRSFYNEVARGYVARGAEKMTAAQRFEFFLDSFISLYQNHKDVLTFNRNFDSYVKHEHCTEMQMSEYNKVVGLFESRFQRIYNKAKEDGTLRIKMSERKMFINTMYIMLSVAGKYAEGLVFPFDYSQDMTEELYMLKKMMLDAYKT